MLDIQPITLRGKWVTLEPMREEHAESLFKNSQDERIWPYMPTTVRTIADIEAIIHDALEGEKKGTDLPFVIRLNETGELVGSSRYLDIQSNNRNLEIGWTWLAPEVWRTAVNSECKYLLLRHAFEELGCVRVQIKTDGRNIQSQQAIARLGAVKEGVLRKSRYVQHGFLRDTVYFSVLEDEWPSVKERLEGFLKI